VLFAEAVMGEMGVLLVSTEPVGRRVKVTKLVIVEVDLEVEFA
jgi:hypothetical protein